MSGLDNAPNQPEVRGMRLGACGGYPATVHKTWHSSGLHLVPGLLFTLNESVNN